MRRYILLTAAAAFCATAGFAASPSIGIASAVGAFSVNSVAVTGNVDVFDGAQLQTTVAPSEVHLGNGVDVRLATRSSGAVFNNRFILREGAVRLANFASYPAEVGDLEIKADTPGAAAIVRVSSKTVEVASIGGSVQVSDGGAMMTRVAAGTKMSFQNSGAGGQATPPAGQTGAQPVQTGAAPAPTEKGPVSDKKAILWSAGVCAVGAVVVGSIAAAQGKSPF